MPAEQRTHRVEDVEGVGLVGAHHRGDGLHHALLCVRLAVDQQHAPAAAPQAAAAVCALLAAGAVREGQAVRADGGEARTLQQACTAARLVSNCRKGRQKLRPPLLPVRQPALADACGKARPPGGGGCRHVHCGRCHHQAVLWQG